MKYGATKDNSLNQFLYRIISGNSQQINNREPNEIEGNTTLTLTGIVLNFYSLTVSPTPNISLSCNLFFTSSS